MSNLSKGLILTAALVIGLFFAAAITFATQFKSNTSGLEVAVGYLLGVLALITPIVLAVYVIKRRLAGPIIVRIAVVILALFVILKLVGY